MNRRKARRFRYVPDMIRRHESLDKLPTKGFYVYSESGEDEMVSHMEMENFFRRVGR